MFLSFAAAQSEAAPTSLLTVVTVNSKNFKCL